MDIILYGQDKNEIIAADIAELCDLADRTTDDYALILTEAEMQAVAVSHTESLERTGRIEVMGGLVSKITEAFCTSPYFSQNDFADGLCRLIEAFYQTKNDCEDLIGDDELIEFMVTNFNNVYGGDLNALIENALPRLSQMLLMGNRSKSNEMPEIEEREYD